MVTRCMVKVPLAILLTLTEGTLPSTAPRPDVAVCSTVGRIRPQSDTRNFLHRRNHAPVHASKSGVKSNGETC